ncbi:MAG: Holliday junction branch migration protein RuvA [Patescibacteria group bacterium]|nr:Holliday junction branch migration protein RuvA [Patescibacteria group bacterium]
MIAYIEGKIGAQGSNFVILNTNCGVGYFVYLPPRLIKGDKLALFVYHYQTEKSDALYGFSDFKERELFERLIKISGLGPKGALALLSIYHSHDLLKIIEDNDVSKLEAAPGIGKKTARKIMAELIDVFQFEEKEPRDEQLVEALKSLGYSAREAQNALGYLNGDEKTLQEKITKILKEVGSVRK